MSFTDIIKNSVLARFNAGDLSTMTMVMTLAMAAAMGVFIYVIYRITAKNSFYNRDFNKSLAVLPPITAGIMLAMQSNLVISLGMVGALSIVRFRNAVKDSSDLAYLFWSISMGIITGAGLFELALLLSVCVTILIVALDMVPTFRAPCILVVSGDKEANEAVLMKCVKGFAKTAKIRSRNITKNGTEWIIEMQAKDEAGLVKAAAEVSGVVSVNLMTHDGEVRF